MRWCQMSDINIGLTLCATVAVNLVCASEQQTTLQHDRDMRNVTSVGIQSPLLGLLSYVFPFRNTRLFMYWSSRRERH